MGESLLVHHADAAVDLDPAGRDVDDAEVARIELVCNKFEARVYR